MQTSARPGVAALALAVAAGALSHKAATLLADWLRRRSQAKDEGGTSGRCDGNGKGKAEPLPTVEQTLALLRQRRSIFPKDYNGKGHAVTDDEVRLLLEAANWAPTHKRTEPWRFVVFKGQAAIKQVLDATVEGNRAATTEERGGETFEKWHADFLDNGIKKKWSKCDVLVSLSMLREAVPSKRLPEWEEIAATACAVQNMHLMATSIGLAGYWSSWNIAGRDSDAMAECLGISKEAGDRCLGFFCIGSSDVRMRSGRGAVTEKTKWVSFPSTLEGA
jgi:nitroreductase